MSEFGGVKLITNCGRLKILQVNETRFVCWHSYKELKIAYREQWICLEARRILQHALRPYVVGRIHISRLTYGVQLSPSQQLHNSLGKAFSNGWERVERDRVRAWHWHGQVGYNKTHTLTLRQRHRHVWGRT
jgi:hypothetical protein